MATHTLKAFPGLSSSITCLLKLRSDDPSYYEKVLEICSSDAGIAAELIRFAHSVAMAPSERLQSVRHALLHVGPRPAVSYLLGGLLIKVFAPTDPMTSVLWHRAAWSAVACEALARDHAGSQVDPGEARAAGLLHDLGQLAMACTEQAKYQELLRRVGGTMSAQLSEERALFGHDHTSLGAHIASDWGIPENLQLVIAEHHTTQATGSQSARRLMRLVRFVDGLYSWGPGKEQDTKVVLLRGQQAGFRWGPDDLEPLRERLEGMARPTIEELGLSQLAAVAG